MLYKKNTEKQLSDELFKNPTAEYRATPFWSWNCKPDKALLERQIDCLKEMGFGGFHMHSRSGMATKYLSEDFFELVKACVAKAKKENMLAYLYDEDRWPSGAAGGLVTKDIRHRQRSLCFTPEKMQDTVSLGDAYISGKPALIAFYDIELDENGYLKSFKRDCEGGNTWYAYFLTDKESGWYNNQTYINTLSTEAMNEFIKLTYEGYKNAVGNEFGNIVPSIFTDEPQFSHKHTFGFAEEKKPVTLSWTYDLTDSFKESYGFDLLDYLPELFWEKANGEYSRARYCYHDHICERFATAFCDNCGNWCGENNLMLTGHVMAEQSLDSQTICLGEAMRQYRSFQLPGIDMLCDGIELSTAKQAQSAVHQYGREGMLSELYGVTNWDFDFRGHKFQGDWQAALGVTVRVPHLSWVSMKGSAKRDYPASISYQSPWYKKYPLVEDHFARLNTALTRGVPDVNVAVIHPIESYWLNYGPLQHTSTRREELETNFSNVINWLLFGNIDFDFISESMLPDLCKAPGNPLPVGKMSYSAVVVPGLETIRKSTLEILKKFAEKGGKVIFMGDAPKYMDAVKSDEPATLYNDCISIQFSKTQLLSSLGSERSIEINNSNGKAADNLIYAKRKDNDCDWLFIAHGKKEPAFEYDLDKAQDIVIKIKGSYTPVEYDTFTGEIKELEFSTGGGFTKINYSLFSRDSLLIRLLPPAKSENTSAKADKKLIRTIDFKEKVKYHTAEPNVYLLDMASYSVDGGTKMPVDEIIRIDEAVRKQLGLVPANGRDTQPWVIEEEIPSHFVRLEFEIVSETDVSDTSLAFEEARSVKLNGKSIDIDINGYYVDEAIKTITLGTINKGKNILEVEVPITNRLSLENMFILGDFDVKVCGSKKTIAPKTGEITFGSIVNQGLAFYGGNVIYETEIDTPECSLEIEASYYRGALLGVVLDDGAESNIIYSPYKASFANVSAGRHKIKFICYGNRYNTFAALHRVSQHPWAGPNMWYTTGCDWSYEYILKDVGILKSPVVKIFER